MMLLDPVTSYLAWGWPALVRRWDDRGYWDVCIAPPGETYRYTAQWTGRGCWS